VHPRHERGELDQIVLSKPCPPLCHDHDGIRGAQARPCRWDRGDMPVSRTIEDPRLTPVLALEDEREFLATPRMEGMRDPNGSGHLLGAGSSALVG